MAQNYLWKVVFEKRYEHGQYSRVFKNKIAAMTFANRLENDRAYENIRIIKWFG